MRRGGPRKGRDGRGRTKGDAEKEERGNLPDAIDALLLHIVRAAAGAIDAVATEHDCLARIVVRFRAASALRRDAASSYHQLQLKVYLTSQPTMHATCNSLEQQLCIFFLVLTHSLYSACSAHRLFLHIWGVQTFRAQLKCSLQSHMKCFGT